MKRCPQCEFIYEDDQSLCDMDGVLLVFDSRTLPNLDALATVEGPMPGKAQRRYRMAPAFATILLVLGLGSAYFVSTRSGAPAAIDSPPSITSEVPAAFPAPSVEEPMPAPTPVPAADVNEAQPPRSEPAAKPEKKPTTATPAKKAVAQPAAVKPAENKKDDSKVGSILKKTGKILKKPFKF